MKKPSFQMSSDTRMLYQTLESVPVGKVINYSDLSAVIAQPVNGATPALNTARRALLRDKDMVFDVIRGVGLKRLADVEIVASGDRHASSIKRKAHKALRTMVAISDYAALPPLSQIQHSVKVAMFSAVGEIASNRGQKKIEKAVGPSAKDLPLKETLQALLGK